MWRNNRLSKRACRADHNRVALAVCQTNESVHALLRGQGVADQPFVGQCITIREKKDLLRLFKQNFEHICQLIGLYFISSDNQQWFLECFRQRGDNIGASYLCDSSQGRDHSGFLKMFDQATKLWSLC